MSDSIIKTLVIQMDRMEARLSKVADLVEEFIEEERERRELDEVPLEMSWPEE